MFVFSCVLLIPFVVVVVVVVGVGQLDSWMFTSQGYDEYDVSNQLLREGRQAEKG